MNMEAANRIAIDAPKFYHLESDSQEDNTNANANANADANTIDIECNREDVILQQAKQKAVEIIANAEDEALTILEKAREIGYKEGLLKCDSELAAFKEKTTEKVIKLTEDAENYKQSVLSGLEKDILDLSFDIAGKILMNELDRNEDAIHPLVVKAIEKVSRDECAILRTDSINYEKVKDIICSLSEGSNITLIPIRKALPGTVILEKEDGIIDMSIHKKLLKAKEILNAD